MCIFAVERVRVVVPEIEQSKHYQLRPRRQQQQQQLYSPENVSNV